MDTKEFLEICEIHSGVEFTEVESTNILGYGYNPKLNGLWIAFKGNQLYRYTPVSKSQYQELCLAESKGKWVHQNLRNNEFLKVSKYGINNK